MKKRGQAALEFLTTYGWAFLVILVMIGALAYFGVLDPSRFLPSRCSFETGITCERFVLDDEGSGVADEARFEITNNFGKSIYIADVEFDEDLDGTYTGCTGYTAETVNNAASTDITCVMADGDLVAGQKQKIGVRIIYNFGNDPDTDYQKPAPGEIYTEVIGS